jgi:hypothetical protein
MKVTGRASVLASRLEVCQFLQNAANDVNDAYQLNPSWPYEVDCKRKGISKPMALNYLRQNVLTISSVAFSSLFLCRHEVPLSCLGARQKPKALDELMCFE